MKSGLRHLLCPGPHATLGFLAFASALVLAAIGLSLAHIGLFATHSVRLVIGVVAVLLVRDGLCLCLRNAR